MHYKKTKYHGKRKKASIRIPSDATLAVNKGRRDGSKYIRENGGFPKEKAV